MKRKAMSPLLSTILLLVFAASLGGVVISWGSSQSALAIYPMSCQSTNLEIVDLGRLDQICYENGRLDFTVQNIGETPIASLKITIIGSNKFYNEIIDAELAQADILKKSVYYDSATGDIQKVFIVPKIRGNSLDKFCPKNGLEIENIIPC